MNIARFEKLYQTQRDPWNYCFSPYEQEKYARTLKALPKIHYKNALEIGCSIGVLTRRLSTRCQHITGIDCAPTALMHARDHCKNMENISFKQAFLPDEWPDGHYDLIIFSEILYYLPKDSIEILARKTAITLSLGGDCICVNYRKPMTEIMQGDEAAMTFNQAFYTDSAFCQPITVETENYRIDILNLED
ncbi:SAM-dependent methyltransferase [Bartonella tamiae]|uniref:Methyltransferase domain-containing protein n=1 Tax=Bartonella tamiae Th239 TaxID=1094558 RepID=J1K0N4_9HYPH|nr:SAM-dependent methyltransferase [Bartonella tamiae]EJF90595.1 hypothetical protein ME5_00996 [Bartonella tamiae Th239]EJF94027.1 hypothetical protein MEG_00885 [Bartonella tamiae Th307]